MMEVLLADGAGFCFGVKRALKIARSILTQAEGASHRQAVYSLGPLVHNSQVVAELEKEGMRIFNDFDDSPKGFLVVRSHGIAPQIREQALNAGWQIVDATCPLVQKIHQLAEKLKEENYHIVIIGHQGHPEVQGIAGFAGDNYTLLENSVQARKMPRKEKIGVLVQTTAPLGEFTKILKILVNKSFELRVFNTLCFETQRRQLSTRKLAKKVDLMVVVGGRNSSNTHRLVEIIRSMGKPVYHIEQPEELNRGDFVNIASVGLTAGASTPPELVERAFKLLTTF